MWLYIVALVLVVFGVVGGFASGGIFTIIFVPLGLLIVVSAAVYGWMGGSAQRRAEAEPPAGAEQPLPSVPGRDSGHVPTSPERLADARRSSQ